MKKILLICITFNLLTYATEKTKIMAPATPSSIPVIIAARNNDWQVDIFHNHSKAHSLFLNGKVDILITGLSVGQKFYEQKIPIKIINSYVSGLSYFVSFQDSVNNFKSLKDKTIYLPFKGSPLEEVTKFFIAQEELSWNTDIKPQYAPFPSTVNLLLNNKIKHAVLPEPFVSRVINSNQNIKISFSYYKMWNKYTKQNNGYPQVATFIKADKKLDKQLLTTLNNALRKSIEFTTNYPDSALKIVKPKFKFSKNILQDALIRTHFQLFAGDTLKDVVRNYYQILGKPLDETYQDFFLHY
ncbi:MAG: hypothetical protein K9M80_03400 [Candidatus Marinimicrobia bacterium]|nr:hypothetical protein [Candidatus Neomarinimicrobiota bacterium]